MSEEHRPGPPARDPGQSVASFVEVFAVWLTRDARPTISEQTRRLQALPTGVHGAEELDLVVRHLQGLLGRLDALAEVMARPLGGPGAREIEQLSSAAADHCNEARTLMARAQRLLGSRPEPEGRTTVDDDCRARPD
ncbi:hypothetical protein [Patulibacter sp.]|uniref:hypothetical protein n=1 Tax=Patulibacter sp. TaxID=1912859 RepID=UPI00272506BE|nr:hypothetical protein [Patulibacter sp.]MDO9409552.1 hypothetical protein [Patulibacter sp.]